MFSTFRLYLVADVTRLKNGEGASRFSRLGKPEFPKFYGDDVKGSMYIVKQFFAVDDVREEDKIKTVSIHIYDRALAWHLQFVRAQRKNVTWPVYEEAILKRFREVNEDPMAELKNLRYKITIKQYQNAFSLLYFHETAMLLNKQKYTSLLPTPRTAYENRNTSYPAKPVTTTLALPNTQTVTKHLDTTTNPPRKRLTQKEISDKRAK
nr:hypothetical protein [Tanacetum cinerariifolium]